MRDVHPHRHRSTPDHEQQDASRRPSPSTPEELIRAAVRAWGAGDGEGAHLAALQAALANQLPSAASVADVMLEAALEELWQRGWTPGDLVHVMARYLTDYHATLAAGYVVADSQRRRKRGQALHPGWQRQLANLEERSAAVDPLSLEERLRNVVEILCVVAWLPTVPRTMPTPGQTWAGSSADAAHLDAGMLARVRALLAKAESTEFEEEAEAFMTKAQELIARHAIDEVLLHTVEDVGEPTVRRIPVDDPYADAKAYLLARVAAANRCRLVHSPDLGWVTAFGYHHDLNAVELLGTSLLTQATAAMVRHGSRIDAYGRSRTRSFRRAFLLGFAQRIGERLREASEQQMAATDDADGRLVPVLAARDDRLRAAEEATFPGLIRRTTSASNPAGWSAGRAAGELATLDVSPHRLPAS